MEKKFKQPETVDKQERSDESTSSETNAVNARRASDDERAHLAKRKRIRAYQKIDYWQ